MEGKNQVTCVLKESMRSLKFGYPVTNAEELDEAVKLCLLFYEVTRNGESVLKKYGEFSKTLDVSLSLTERCGNQCRHCSTNATLARDKTNVPFEDLDRALAEMSPYVKTLCISCEGDPFYYESTATSENGKNITKNVVDVTRLIMRHKFGCVSIQSMAPDPRRQHLMREMLNVIDQERGPGFRFVPQVSFNLYTLRAGLKTRSRVDGNGCGYQELCVPLVENDKVLDWMIQSIRFQTKIVGVNAIDGGIFEESPPALEAAEKLRRYVSDVKLTILEYARRDYEIHFELRGDTFSGFTNLANTESVLTEILRELSEEHPEITFPKCPVCSKVHFDQKSAFIIPLGRAANLFPNGHDEERTFFDKHVKMNPHKYLCDNWLSWGSMIIDTKGFPQLCYSNVALTPTARTTKGPNLYKDGFERIRRFYVRVWEDRIDFLKNNLHNLIRTRPNKNYCPLDLFKQTLNSFTESIC
jgi:hypothetical protein